MNPRRGLIGFFIFVFLLSGISLITLVIDDKKDLSSLASTGVTLSKEKALPDLSFSQNLLQYHGVSGTDIPVNLQYDNSLWLPPESNDKDNVFINRRQYYSVRVVPSAEISEPQLGKFLGSDFVLVKKISPVQTLLPGWKMVSFLYKFYGEDKGVELWQGDSNFSLLVVLPKGATHEDILTFVKGFADSSQKVKGISTTQDDSARLAALSRPSVVLILTNYCSKAKLGTIPNTVISNKEYPFCLSATGTGFFVNPNGYIATNGHVVNIGPQTALLAAVTTGQFNDLLVDYTAAYLQQSGLVVPRDQIVEKVKESLNTKESLYQLAGAIDRLRTTNLLSIQGDDYKYFIQAGSTPIQITKSGVNTGKDILSARLIGFDYAEPTSEGFSSSDVALLKVEGNNFPALPLGSLEDVTTGEELQIIGFPGIAGGNNSVLLDSSANAEPTITRGVVSALKKAKGNQKNLIQTDASINHGNSGGPALDSNGKVIGIATYGLMPEEGGGNYNFLRDIGDLKDLMNKYNVDQNSGPTYQSWKNGLNNYWLSYFKYAKTDFTKTKELYPIHPSVDKYLKETNSKINSTADITPMFTRAQRKIYMTISGVVMSISVIGILFLLIAGKKMSSGKQNLIYSNPPQNPPPVQTF